MLTFGVVILRNNAHPRTDARTRALQEYFNWELSDHPPYSPDLTPSDYHQFTRTYKKNCLRSQRFNNSEELTEGVKTWLSSQAADFFHTGLQKIIPRYEKSHNSGGDYVKK
jgi:hypothetical protein